MRATSPPIPRARPSAADLQAARDRTLRDVIAPDLDVLFVGINPSLWSAAVGHHFARPGNRFWPALWRGGFTPRLLAPEEDELLPSFGCGVTNLVARATARADELAPDELRAGARRLARKVACWHPRFVAIVGVTAYRVALARPDATRGEQPERMGRARMWVLPNPSGLNAHDQLPSLARQFSALRRAVR